jgi:hypothetical protein
MNTQQVIELVDELISAACDAADYEAPLPYQTNAKEKLRELRLNAIAILAGEPIFGCPPNTQDALIGRREPWPTVSIPRSECESRRILIDCRSPASVPFKIPEGHAIQPGSDLVAYPSADEQFELEIPDGVGTFQVKSRCGKWSGEITVEYSGNQRFLVYANLTGPPKPPSPETASTS